MRVLKAFAALVALTALLVAATACEQDPYRYRCDIVSAPESIAKGRVLTVGVRYSNLGRYGWYDGNTNPVLTYYGDGRVLAEATPKDPDYWVGSGESVRLWFERGTGDFPRGRIRVTARMYRASVGNTTTLMPGTGCSRYIRIT